VKKYPLDYPELHRYFLRQAEHRFRDLKASQSRALRRGEDVSLLRAATLATADEIVDLKNRRPQ
jgi:hypothetical protein